MPEHDPAFVAQVRALLEPQLDAALGAPAPPGLLDGLSSFCGALSRANLKLNLTGLKSPEDMVYGHILDSLIALPLIPTKGMLFDLGSGCGVPGIPLGLVHPEMQVRLCESRQKKAAALVGIVDELGLSPRIQSLNARAEEWLHRGSAQTVVARAVGPMTRLLPQLAPVREAIGRLVLLKGPGADEDLSEIEPLLPDLGWKLVDRLDAALPEDRGQRVVLAFEAY